MTDPHLLHFGPYRLDAGNAQLWHESRPVRLTAKALQVLSYLAERPGQLVTKEELFEAVWAEAVVSDATLTSNIQAVRQALGDDARSPRYIETVHRRGFRFIEKVVSSQHSGVSREEPSANGQEVDTVMPAQAGIQGPQAQASGESSWIPAFAGMTLPSSSPQTHSSSPQPSQTLDPRLRLGSLDEAQRNPGKTPETGSRIALRSIRATELVSSTSSTTSTLRRFRWWQVLLLVVLLVLGGGLAANWRLVRLVAASYFPPPVPEPLALPLPDKPSLVVLPLVNLSGDSSQEYFSDGLTDDLINTLAQFPDVFVIARQSAFTYKGETIKEQDIGRELGVRYVLTGSVRRAGEQVRMNVQLVDATTGEQVWAERYNRPFTEIFALQDDLVQTLATTLKLQLPLLKQGLSIVKTTDNVEAYDYVLRGAAHFLRYSTQKENLQAREFFETALRFDPQYAEACALIGLTYYMEWAMQWNRDPQILERTLEYGQRAIALGDFYGSGHTVLALVYVQKAQIDRALSEIERVIALQPNSAESYHVQAEVLMVAGRPAEALQSIQHALRLNPRGPFIYFATLGWAYNHTEQYAESIAAYKRAFTLNPLVSLAYLMQAFSYLGQWMAQQSHDPKILDLAYDAVQNAIALDAAPSFAHTVLGTVYLWQKRYDAAITEYERAATFAGITVCNQMEVAGGLSLAGRVEEAVRIGERALRLKALPLDDRCLYGVATAYRLAGRLEEAAVLYQRLFQRYPNLPLPRLGLAAIYSQLGRETEAQAAAAEVLRINPNFSLEVYKQRVPIKDPAALEQQISALRKAGLK